MSIDDLIDRLIEQDDEDLGMDMSVRDPEDTRQLRSDELDGAKEEVFDSFLQIHPTDLARAVVRATSEIPELDDVYISPLMDAFIKIAEKSGPETFVRAVLDTVSTVDELADLVDDLRSQGLMS